MTPPRVYASSEVRRQRTNHSTAGMLVRLTIMCYLFRNQHKQERDPGLFQFSTGLNIISSRAPMYTFQSATLDDATASRRGGGKKGSPRTGPDTFDNTAAGGRGRGMIGRRGRWSALSRYGIWKAELVLPHIKYVKARPKV